jgi:hypothetical protein
LSWSCPILRIHIVWRGRAARTATGPWKMPSRLWRWWWCRRWRRCSSGRWVERFGAGVRACDGRGCGKTVCGRDRACWAPWGVWGGGFCFGPDGVYCFPLCRGADDGKSDGPEAEGLGGNPWVGGLGWAPVLPSGGIAGQGLGWFRGLRSGGARRGGVDTDWPAGLRWKSCSGAGSGREAAEEMLIATVREFDSDLEETLKTRI